MADIISFRGIYFKPQKENKLKNVTCPPYDVISPKRQEYFYRLHPHNVIRLILGRKKSSDTKAINRHSRAAKYFKDWLNTGILEKEKSPCIYIYRQKYSFQNKRYSPVGFIALSRLESWREKKILPHEVIFSKYKNDRLQLLRASKANFESILALYPHSARIEKILRKGIVSRPFLKIIDEEKVEHAIYPLSSLKEISVIKKEMKKRPLFIADGHHRYQAALNFSREVNRSKSPPKYKKADYLMVTFMDMERSKLTIFPTHRIVSKLPRFSSKRFLDSLRPYFQVEKVSSKIFYQQLKKEAGGQTAFGLFLGGDNYFLIKLKTRLDLKRLIKEKKSTAWKKLDVAILHKLIFDKVLKGRANNYLSYTRSAKEAERKVKTGQAKMAFFLNPTKIEDIQSIASRGERMPPKSTYFYPKLRSGLIMREIDG